MSIRNIRKLYGDNSLPPPEGNSDEEYEPLYAKKASVNPYEGLVLSSHSESEQELIDAVEVEDIPTEAKLKKKKKKKKQKRKAKQMAYSKEEYEELDEIDKSLMEVNALLGAPPEAPSVSEKPPPDPSEQLLEVHYKHLNVTYELRRLFGPEENVKRRGRQPNLHRIRKAVIVPLTDNQNFQKSGLSMSIDRREFGCTYFWFDHSREYQRMHHAFLHLSMYGPENLAMFMDDARSKMHVEGMLESADSTFRVESYSIANTLIEEAIACMQFVAHPSFNLVDPNVRLEYRIVENRAFHIAVLKYLYLLTNRACHRTALELAKLLLSLDPSDPLAILFIIDTLALRAREHQWLIDAVDFWTKERDAGFLFNVQYSYAMSHFHVASKNKVPLTQADEYMKEAIMRFPVLATRMLEAAGAPLSARAKASVLFNTAEETTGKNMKELMALYVKFTWSKWREPPVLEWLLRNIDELAVRYDNNPQVQERAKYLTNERLNLFRGWPDEIIRHMCVIKPMANLLVDGVITVSRSHRGRAADPVPPSNGYSKYGYNVVPSAPATTGYHTSLYHLISSVLPHYRLPLPQELQRQVVEAGRQQMHLLANLRERQAAAGVIEGDNDALTEEEDSDAEAEAEDDSDEEERPAVALSVNALTSAIRRIIDVYETGQDPGDTPVRNQRGARPREQLNALPQAPHNDHSQNQNDAHSQNQSDAHSRDQSDSHSQIDAHSLAQLEVHAHADHESPSQGLSISHDQNEARSQIQRNDHSQDQCCPDYLVAAQIESNDQNVDHEQGQSVDGSLDWIDLIERFDVRVQFEGSELDAPFDVRSQDRRDSHAQHDAPAHDQGDAHPQDQREDLSGDRTTDDHGHDHA